MKENINQSFEKIMNNSFIRIDGYLVEKGVDPETGKPGLRWGKSWYKDEESVKKAVDETCKLLTISIVRNGVHDQLPPEYVEPYLKGESGWDKFNKEQQKSDQH